MERESSGVPIDLIQPSLERIRAEFQETQSVVPLPAAELLMTHARGVPGSEASVMEHENRQPEDVPVGA